MKKIIKPHEKEKAVYFSDFSGKPLDVFPPVTLKFDFGYGSIYDGSTMEFHLTDDESNKLLQLIKNNLTEDKKKEIKKQISFLESQYQFSCETRDWGNCDLVCNDIALLKKII